MWGEKKLILMLAKLLNHYSNPIHVRLAMLLWGLSTFPKLAPILNAISFIFSNTISDIEDIVEMKTASTQPTFLSLYLNYQFPPAKLTIHKFLRPQPMFLINHTSSSVFDGKITFFMSFILIVFSLPLSFTLFIHYIYVLYIL